MRFFYLVSGMLAFFLASCSSPLDQAPLTYSFFGLDTINQVQFYPTDNRDYQPLIDMAKQHVLQTEQWFNPYDEGSSISQLNARGAAILPQEVVQVLLEAMRVAEESNGAFDPTIRPLVTLWDIGGDFPRVPQQDDILSRLPLVNFRLLQFNRQTGRVSFAQPGMALDPGGIAKGYAADRIAQTFQQKKVGTALVNLGGNILLIGDKPNGQPWRLGLRSGPKGETSMELSLEGSWAVSTAGIYERYFEQDGKHYHHILDPKTGYPVENGLASVTVISRGLSMTADALSTALFVMGEEAGLALAAQEKAEVIFVNIDKSISTSAGIAKPDEEGGPLRISRLSPGYKLVSAPPKTDNRN